MFEDSDDEDAEGLLVLCRRSFMMLPISRCLRARLWVIAVFVDFMSLWSNFHQHKLFFENKLCVAADQASLSSASERRCGRM